MHGLCSRIEAAGFQDDVFCIMHTLQSLYKEEYKVLCGVGGGREGRKATWQLGGLVGA